MGCSSTTSNVQNPQQSFKQLQEQKQSIITSLNEINILITNTIENDKQKEKKESFKKQNKNRKEIISTSLPKDFVFSYNQTIRQQFLEIIKFKQIKQSSQVLIGAIRSSESLYEDVESLPNSSNHLNSSNNSSKGLNANFELYIKFAHDQQTLVRSKQIRITSYQQILQNADITNLKGLYLNNMICGITAGLSTIIQIKSLQSIHLQNSRLQDNDLKTILNELNCLNKLNVKFNDSLTAEAFKGIKVTNLILGWRQSNQNKLKNILMIIEEIELIKELTIYVKMEYEIIQKISQKLKHIQKLTYVQQSDSRQLFQWEIIEIIKMKTLKELQLLNEDNKIQRTYVSEHIMNRLRNNLRNIKENNIVSFIFDDRYVHES